MSIRLGGRQLRVGVARDAVIPRIALDAPEIIGDLLQLDDMCTWQFRTAYRRGKFTMWRSRLGTGARFSGDRQWNKHTNQADYGNNTALPFPGCKRSWLTMDWIGHLLRAVIFLNEFFRSLTIASHPLLQDLRFHPGTMSELPFEPSQAFVGNAFASGNAGCAFHMGRLTRFAHWRTSVHVLHRESCTSHALRHPAG